MSTFNGLNEQQQAAASYQGPAKNLLVVAGAGTGKTSTLTGRIEHLIRNEKIPAKKILCLTFTNRSAAEMKQRLYKSLGDDVKGLFAGTFHAFCLAIAKRMPDTFASKQYNIIDRDDQVSLMDMARAYITKDMDDDDLKEFPSSKKIIEAYSYARNTCVSLKDYLNQYTQWEDGIINLCHEIANNYEVRKSDRGYIDFDDLMIRFLEMANFQEKLRDYLGNYYHEVLIDETQDTNPLQFQVLDLLTAGKTRMFAVGDPAQSIYGFRGADFETLNHFQDHYDQSEILYLSKNYRSNQNILDVSNWLLERSSIDYKNKLTSARGIEGGLPKVVNFNNSYEESDWIARDIDRRRQSGTPLEDIFILVRTGFSARGIETALAQNRIPYQFIGGMSLLKSAHVRDLVSSLRTFINPKDELAWMRFLQLYKGVGPKKAEKVTQTLVNDAEDCQRALEILCEQLGDDHPAVELYELGSLAKENELNLVSTIADAMEPIIKEKYDKKERRIKDLKMLGKVSEKYKRLERFIEDFTLEPKTSSQLEGREDDDRDQVTLITVHSAKGLENKICYVAQCNAGMYPHKNSLGDFDSEEEERRLLYVAITRAEDELIITRSHDEKAIIEAINLSALNHYLLDELPQGIEELSPAVGQRPNQRQFNKRENNYRMRGPRPTFK